MTQFRPTMIASLVASALTVGSIGAVTASPGNPANFDLRSESKLVSMGASSQRALADRATVSGVKSNYDERMGKATFVWRGVDQVKPDMSMIAPEQRNEYAANFYLQSLTGLSADKSSSVVLRDIHDTSRGGVIAKYKQEVHGVEVFNHEYNVMIDRNFDLVAGSGYLADSASRKYDFAILANFSSPEAAINKAFQDLGNTSVSLNKIGDKDKYASYEAVATDSNLVVVGTPRAKKVFFENNGKLKAAYYVEVQLAEVDSVDSSYYSYVIDAVSNNILFRKNLISHAEYNYRAFAKEDGFPMQGPHGKVIPAEGPDQVDTTVIAEQPMISIDHYSKISTMDPWLPEGATTTSGNNAFAYADIAPPQDFGEGDLTAEITSTDTFDYPLLPSTDENSVANSKSAVVNLFYLNNFLHDYYYDHGFDEAAGNAQNDNYGRGGVEGDALEVQGQDYSGLNNANMGTPADGASPRMQMYLYDNKDAQVGVDYGTTITSHPDVGLLEDAQQMGFGLIEFADFTGDLVVVDDGNDTDSNSTRDGCETPVNAADLAGKVVVIDRGSCEFGVKVLNAQQAGATGAIIVTYEGAIPFNGGGGAVGDQVTIPSVMINYEDGESIYSLLEDGETVSVSMFNQPLPYKDGTFDNGIIAHEWGHYISNRLVGNASGLGNQQGGAMGEGWSDFHSLLFIAEESDINIEGNDQFQKAYGSGTYVEPFYHGIRLYPYSTNMDINPHTFADITNNPQVHAAGTVWATILWDAYVALINEIGFATAQSRMADYLVAGYKMTPVSPTYTEARDGILAAAYAADQADFETILGAFARRGMGLGAVSPDRNDDNLEGVVESTATELAVYQVNSVSLDNNYLGATMGYCSSDNILDRGETGSVSVSIKNTGSEMLTGVQGQLVVTSGHDVTFANGGMITFDDMMPYASATVSDIEMTLNDAGIAEDLVIEVQFPEKTADDDIVEPAASSVTTTVNVDFESTPLVGNSATTDMESYAVYADFKENVMSGGDLAVGTQGVEQGNTQFFDAASADAGTNFGLGTQAMYLVNNAFTSDVAVETVPVTVSGDFSVDFWHFYALEETYDGGVIEVRVDGGDWMDVEAAGGTFAVGYNSELSGSGIFPGREAFHGWNTDFAVWGNTETISFGDALDGKQVELRFRIATDGGASDFGWWIDNVTFTGIASSVYHDVVAGDTFACDQRAPVINVAFPELNVNERSIVTMDASSTVDLDGDALTYSWTQTSGTAVTLVDGNTSMAMFESPSVDADETLTFNVMVSDGNSSDSTQVSVNVVNVDGSDGTNGTDGAAGAAGINGEKGSKGGSMGIIALLTLPLVWLRRRVKK